MRLIDADKIIFREIDEIGGEYEPYLGCSKSQIDSLPSVTPQPCEDAVSRQAVLDLIADYDLSMGQVVRGIHALPSVTPQEQKTGHWREDIDNNRRWDRVRFYCSECGQWQTYGKTDYCPDCGAKMVEPQESGDKE